MTLLLGCLGFACIAIHAIPSALPVISVHDLRPTCCTTPPLACVKATLSFRPPPVPPLGRPFLRWPRRQIFPRHVLAYMTEEGGPWGAPAEPDPMGWRPMVRDINKLATSHNEVRCVGGWEVLRRGALYRSAMPYQVRRAAAPASCVSCLLFLPGPALRVRPWGT
jgi:hypothetical protein